MSHPLPLYVAYREAGFSAAETAFDLQVSISLVNTRLAMARAAGMISDPVVRRARSKKDAFGALARAIARHHKTLPPGPAGDAMLEALDRADTRYKEL
jgi:hypothetical protein